MSEFSFARPAMTLISNFETAVRAVGTMCTLAMCGLYLRRIGVLSTRMSKSLSEIAMKVTIPCLLFTTALDCEQNRSQAPSADLGVAIRTGWPLLLFPVFYVVIGLGVGALCGKLGRAEPNFRCTAIAAVAFGNCTGMPTTLLAAIHSQGGRHTHLGAVDPLLFLSVYLSVYPVLQWSIGAWLLQPRPRPTELEAPRSSPENEMHVLSPERSGLDVELNVTPPPVVSGQNRWCEWSALRVILLRVCPPPVIAVLLGLLVTSTPPLHRVFVDTTSRSDSAPLEWFFDGLQKVGRAAVPINMFILGGSLAKGVNTEVVSIRTAAALAFGKMVIMPLVGIVLTLSVKALRLVPPDDMGDSFLLVCLVCSATPTANNIMVMAQLAGENTEALAACLCFQYLLSPVVLSLWLAIFIDIATRPG